jgi:hypothetical protein
MKKMDEGTREAIYYLIAWIDDVEGTRPLFQNLCELVDRFPEGEE